MPPTCSGALCVLGTGRFPRCSGGMAGGASPRDEVSCRMCLSRPPGGLDSYLQRRLALQHRARFLRSLVVSLFSSCLAGACTGRRRAGKLGPVGCRARLCSAGLLRASPRGLAADSLRNPVRSLRSCASQGLAGITRSVFSGLRAAWSSPPRPASSPASGPQFPHL